MRTPNLIPLLLAAGCGFLPLSEEEEAPAGKAANGVQPTPAQAVELHVVSATISMVTVKDGGSEVPATFTGMTGTLVASTPGLDGLAGALTIDLDSWDSGLALRDERVKDLFFTVSDNPTATFSLEALRGTPPQGLSVGEDARVSGTGTLYLAGGSVPVDASLVLERTGEGEYELASAEPFTVSINSMGLADPLQELMRVCQHKSVSDAVAVSATIRLATTPRPTTSGVVAPQPSEDEPPAEEDASGKGRSPTPKAGSPEMRNRLDDFRSKRKGGKRKSKSKSKGKR